MVEIPTVVLMCLFWGLVVGLLRPRPSLEQVEQSSKQRKVPWAQQPVSMTTVINCSPVSKTPAINCSPVINLLPVSMTPAITENPWQELITGVVGVVDTGNKFFTGVVDTAEQLFVGVLDTADKHSFANISAIFFKKIQNSPNRILGGLGDTDLWKKPESKISCQTPFKCLLKSVLWNQIQDPVTF